MARTVRFLQLAQLVLVFPLLDIAVLYRFNSVTIHDRALEYGSNVMHVTVLKVMCLIFNFKLQTS